jgi:hypothetical protein
MRIATWRKQAAKLDSMGSRCLANPGNPPPGRHGFPPGEGEKLSLPGTRTTGLSLYAFPAAHPAMIGFPNAEALAKGYDEAKSYTQITVDREMSRAKPGGVVGSRRGGARAASRGLSIRSSEHPDVSGQQELRPAQRLPAPQEPLLGVE